ncbi:hypothetical protein [Candidatus Frankia alpina]|uniref:hypothetical protein n=1 Tax=Candidatus Frankia alpina TaxID=2699483 RepID=UPI001386F87F|nr:hypothetical protein [Candidatus Frankia alpina]
MVTRGTAPTMGTAEGTESGGTGRHRRPPPGGLRAADGITDTAFGAAALELGRASVELGAAYRALERVMAAVLVALRAVAILLTLFYLVIWHWYAGQPAATAVVALSVGWGVFFCVMGLRRGVDRPLAAASVVVALALALTAERWLPPESVGDSGNFVFLTAVNAAIVAVWAFPPLLAAPGVLLLGAGVLVGGWGHTRRSSSSRPSWCWCWCWCWCWRWCWCWCWCRGCWASRSAGCVRSPVPPTGAGRTSWRATAARRWSTRSPGTVESASGSSTTRSSTR